jgi:quinol-cytochrome oxidoreductase complex cytochrome b subunit
MNKEKLKKIITLIGDICWWMIIAGLITLTIYSAIHPIELTTEDLSSLLTAFIALVTIVFLMYTMISRNTFSSKDKNK